LRLHRLTEILYAWSMHDVVALVIFNYSFELGPYVQYLLTPRCAPLNRVLAEAFADLVSAPVCLKIDAELAPGMLLLGAAVGISTACGLYAMWRARPGLEAC
jgi:hypothetical protein